MLKTIKTKGFDRLLENVESTIFEGLLKLGPIQGGSLSIYYDLDLLNHLLDTHFDNNEECYSYLKKFMEYVRVSLSDLKIQIEKKRFKFTLEQNSLFYIYEHNKNNHFLKDIIETVKSHRFTLEDILTIFKKYSSDYICENMDNAEFQYVIYFKDQSIDRFKYCFNFDEMGGYYHRLLDYNYDKIIHE